MSDTQLNIVAVISGASLAVIVVMISALVFRLDHAYRKTEFALAVSRSVSLSRLIVRIVLPVALLAVATFSIYVRQSASISLAGDWWVAAVAAIAFVAGITAFVFVIAEGALAGRSATEGSAESEETLWRMNRAIMFGRGTIVLLIIVATLAVAQPSTPLTSGIVS